MNGRSIANVAATAVIGALALVLLVVALAPLTLGWRYVIVAGGSMEPAIPYGSIAVMEAAGGHDVAPGDVITFRDGRGLLVTHRIIGTAAAGFVTQGDANNIPDAAPVPHDAVLGRYLFAVPHAGTLAHSVASPAGIALAVVIPGSLVIAIQLATVGRTIRSNRSKPRAS